MTESRLLMLHYMTSKMLWAWSPSQITLYDKQDAMGMKSLSDLIQSSNKKTRHHLLCLVPGVHLPPCPAEIKLASPLTERENTMNTTTWVPELYNIFMLAEIMMKGRIRCCRAFILSATSWTCLWPELYTPNMLCYLL